ncbi:MAG: arylsulfatase [Akkermansiaceae bacterium]|nr:arylsulfatase [Akkermansiaceae bacterium]
MKALVHLALGILFSTACFAQKPNIIVILLDDMGYSDLGAYGGEVHTPNIDRLAANGLRFTQNYNSARCCPSRAALLTGLYSHQAGIADFTSSDQSAHRGPAYLNRLNKQCVTLAEVLKPAGYATYAVGKWHVGHTEDPIMRGFDEFYGFIRGHSQRQWNRQAYIRLPADRTPEIQFEEGEFYATEAFNAYAIEFLKKPRKPDQPFFLYLAHSSPHFPLHAPAATRDTYLDTYRKGWDQLRKERYERQQMSGLATASWSFTPLSEVPVDEDKIANGFAGKPNPDWDDVPAARQEDLAYRMATFAAMIEHVDRGVGRIIKLLETSGELDNTLILLTSDNGACYEWGPFGFDESSRMGKTILHEGEQLRHIGGPGTYHSVGSAWSCLSNTPLRLYKHFNHEGGNCSPLIAHWPKGIDKPNRWVRTPVHLIDFMPTIQDAAGAEYPQHFHGHDINPSEGTSLLPVFQGAETLPARTLCFDHFESSAIRDGDWKLVRGNQRYKQRTWELYNIANDRCETKDLINEMPELATKLEAKWTEWAKRVKITPYYQHPKKP